jgi:hypothetical protein
MSSFVQENTNFCSAIEAVQHLGIPLQGAGRLAQGFGLHTPVVGRPRRAGTRTIAMSRWLFRRPFSRAWPEADDEPTDREAVVIELMEGQYSNPVRVVAFNTAEGWVA